MNYELVIGLETHVELSTNSKIFCSCGGHSAANEPNDCVCPACSGMPGMLPVMNKKVVELVKQQHQKATQILLENRSKLDELAQFLYERETITGEEFMNILGS